MNYIIEDMFEIQEADLTPINKMKPIKSRYERKAPNRKSIKEEDIISFSDQ